MSDDSQQALHPIGLHELLFMAAREYPHASFSRGSLNRVSTTDLARWASEFSNALIAARMARSTRIVLRTSDHPAALAIASGAAMSGHVCAVLAPKGAVESGSIELTDGDLDALTDGTLPKLPDGHTDRLEVGSRWISTDPCLEFSTSGSSGRSSSVLSPHHSVLNAVEAIARRLALSQEDRILSAIPLHFDYGYYQLLMALSRGCDHFQAPAKNGLRSLRSALRSWEPTVLALNPYIIRVLASHNALPGRSTSFRSVRMITSTGSHFPIEHTSSLRRLFPEAEIFSMYGLTECKRVTIGTGEDFDANPRSVGHPISNVRLRIATDGEILIQSGSLMQFSNDLQDRPQLDERLVDDGLWLLTGDFGSFDADGRLVVQGRRDDLLKIRDVRISRLDYEARLRASPLVQDAAASVITTEFGDEIGGWVEPIAGSVLDDGDLLATFEDYPPGIRPRWIRVLDKLPRLSNAKVDYRALDRLASQ